MYILFWTLIGYTSGLAAGSQEFTSKEKAEAAGEALVALNDSFKYTIVPL